MALGWFQTWCVAGLIAVSAHAKEIEKVSFSDSTTAAGQELQLNGVGLRTKRKLGMDFRVYVAGLYLKTKSTDAATIVGSDEAKVLELVFLRSVDADTLREAWQEGYDKNCKAGCDTSKAQLKQFKDAMADVGDGSKLKMIFDKDSVTVEGQGKKAAMNAKIIGGAFSRNLLAIFIGDTPPTEVLKKGLLGQ